MLLKIEETTLLIRSSLDWVEGTFRETSMRDLTAVVVLGIEKLQFNPPRYLGSQVEMKCLKNKDLLMAFLQEIVFKELFRNDK